MRRKDNGDLLRRSFCGQESDYKAAEAAKFLSKLDSLHKARSFVNRSFTNKRPGNFQKLEVKGMRQASCFENQITHPTVKSQLSFKGDFSVSTKRSQPFDDMIGVHDISPNERRVLDEFI